MKKKTIRPGTRRGAPFGSRRVLEEAHLVITREDPTRTPVGLVMTFDPDGLFEGVPLDVHSLGETARGFAALKGEVDGDQVGRNAALIRERKKGLDGNDCCNDSAEVDEPIAGESYSKTPGNVCNNED